MKKKNAKCERQIKILIKQSIYFIKIIKIDWKKRNLKGQQKKGFKVF